MTLETALSRIRRAAESGATELDLSGLGLTSLSPEIGNLTSLTELNLQYNELTSLPPEIGNLTRLTTLDLSDNQLSSLPPELWELPALKHLNISGNPLSEIPPALWRKTDWESLGLVGLGLTSLPPEIGNLTSLTELNLQYNELTSLPPEIGNLTSLTTLVLSGNPLPSLPPEIGKLTNLTRLDLSRNRLTSLPPEIGSLTNLTRLDLGDNQLTSLPPELWKLPALKHLDISDNPLSEIPPALWRKTDWESLELVGLGLTSLPPEISNLTSLTRLDLSENKMTTLPPGIVRLTKLTVLRLGFNQLTSLPPEIGNLINLSILYLTGNQLSTLPPEIGKLLNLTTLYLGNNQLRSLPPEIGNLTSLNELYLGSNLLTFIPPELWEVPTLKCLDISYNPLPHIPPDLWRQTDLETLDLSGLNLTSLPPEIGQLTNLRTLDLESNQITSLPPEIGKLVRLQDLNIQDNQITSLPASIAQLTQLEILKLHDNPIALALPRALLGDEILGGDAQAIFRFYRAIWEAGQELGEVRVLFVGQPAVGKTSLVHRLKDGSYDPNRPSTMTVETHALPFGTVTARVWDFGGQDFMHATHPFFFSARCVYVLVLNVRQTYEQNRVEYWLRTIRAFGGESPVVLVGNHADATQHVLDLPYNRLKRDFPQIAAFVQTSAAENRGLEALRAALEEAIRSLPHVRVRFAQSHLRVKEALEQEKERRDIIPYERYAELCTTEGIEDEEDQRTLLALLHDLGVVLDFRNEAGEPLSPDGVLNPNWVTDAIYRIITDQELRSSAAGRLTPAMTRRILHEYQPYHRDLILKLLQRFELAYPAPEAGVWYLPNAMPQDEPPEAADPSWAQGLTLEYAYTTLPESVITRFIVRAHEHIEAGRVWRWGVILASGENRALVRANVAERRVEIHVLGQENTRRDLLAFIRGHFRAIHKTFQESAGRENFPIQEYLCPPEYPGLRLDYQDLLIREREGETEIRPTWQGRVLRLNVAQVLNGFISPEARQEEMHMAKEIHYHEHRHFEAKEVVGSMVNLGNENQLQQTIQGSFNSGLTSEVQTTLAQLTAVVQEMLKHLSAEQAEETAEDLKRLQEELSKPKPNKKWYSVSIEGLIKAAENVGKIGAPVIQLARKLLQLLG